MEAIQDVQQVCVRKMSHIDEMTNCMPMSLWKNIWRLSWVTLMQNRPEKEMKILMFVNKKKIKSFYYRISR